jgi:hypothetical protein
MILGRGVGTWDSPKLESNAASVDKVNKFDERKPSGETYKSQRNVQFSSSASAEPARVNTTNMLPQTIFSTIVFAAIGEV